MSKHSYIVDILERRPTYCGEKNCGVRDSVWKVLRRIWIESVTVSKIARKIEIQKWPYLKKDIDLHSLQNCTALQHCFEMKAARPPIIRIKYSLFSLSTQMLLPGSYLWQLIPVRSLYSLRGFEVLQPLIVNCLQSAFSLKIRLVLVSSSAIANHDVIITIRDWDHISSRAYALVSRGSRLCRLRA